MKIVIVYKQERDYTRAVEEWIDSFERRTAYKIDVLNPDSPEGETFCSVRNVMDLPAVSVVGEDGRTYEMWLGMPLPLIDEVVSYYSL